MFMINDDRVRKCGNGIINKCNNDQGLLNSGWRKNCAANKMCLLDMDM